VGTEQEFLQNGRSMFNVRVKIVGGFGVNKVALQYFQLVRRGLGFVVRNAVVKLPVAAAISSMCWLSTTVSPPAPTPFRSMGYRATWLAARAA